MNHADHVALIEGGVGERGGRWADLGAGEGAFTLALADLAGPDAQIIAVDKDARALRELRGRFETRVADFTRPLNLHDLEGVVMANSLHYVRDKEPVLRAVRAMLRPDQQARFDKIRPHAPPFPHLGHGPPGPEHGPPH